MRSNTEHIRESIEIQRTPADVFAYLRQIEPRLRLNPSYKLVEFRRLTEGPVRKGFRYMVKAIAEGQLIEYEGEVLEFVENERLTTGDSAGRLRVTLTLKPIQKDTLLIHDEEFIIPDEILYLEPQESGIPFWQRVLKFLIDIERIRIDERERRLEALKHLLRERLRIWLRSIKEEIEGSYIQKDKLF